MCRIAGLVVNGSNNDDLKSTVATMCQALQHGGPDDEGVFCSNDARVAFGHRRLSIIDLSSNGHQPMADNAHTAWLTFNGEIYNYRELKSELLSLGARFETLTDTEVIIQAYLHWGTNSFNKLRGMFAFALYDTRSSTIYLVRDSTGVKPLYYYVTNTGLYFASEIRAFKAAGITKTEDSRWPVWLLSFGHIPEPFTALKNVLNIPKGHFLCFNTDGTYTLNDYRTTTTAIKYITDFETAKAGLQNHLITAIRRQLIADAPIGVFLSGGIDSSLLALLANNEIEQLKTISIFFNEQEYDERRYQQAVTDKISGENFTHLVRQQDFDEAFAQILSAMDMPTTDGINSWFISKYARQDGLKTVLSGIGADELFGGYPSFSRMKMLRYLKMFPAAFFTLTKLFSKDRFKKLAYLENDDPVADYLFLRGLYVPADIAQLTGMDEDEVKGILFDDIEIPHFDSFNKLQAAWMESNIYMKNQLLRDTDVMGMTHGLEVRVPFLDEDFQAYVAQIHPAVRFDDRQPKKILIDSFNDILPKTVWNRPKMGFTFPLQQWMKENKAVVDESNYAGKAAKKLVRNFSKGQIHWSRIFALYQVQGHV